MRKAIELEPENVMAYGGVAQSYLNKGELDLALRYYKKVVEPEPNATWTYARMGEIYVLDRNDLQNALLQRVHEKKAGLRAEAREIE